MMNRKDYCEGSTDHCIDNHVQNRGRFDRSSGRCRRLLLWMLAEGEAEQRWSAWQRWRGGGNCTCLGGRKPHTPLSAQQGERDVQLIIQAALRHSAWVTLSWWADRGKPRMPFEQKERKREEEMRKKERWMSLVVKCNPTLAFISLSRLHLKCCPLLLR